MPDEKDLNERISDIAKGGAQKYHDANAKKGKLFVRDRLKLLLDEGLDLEDAFFANCMSEGLPADGVVTGIGKIGGQTVCVMANDSTVKAGSWGARTVEKIIRIQETAEKLHCPLFYLVDSAGARITDQVDMFPGRRGRAGSFTIKSNYPVASRKSVCCSALPQRAAPTSRPSAISSSWSTETLQCT